MNIEIGKKYEMTTSRYDIKGKKEKSAVRIVEILEIENREVRYRLEDGKELWVAIRGIEKLIEVLDDKCKFYELDAEQKAEHEAYSNGIEQTKECNSIPHQCQQFCKHLKTKSAYRGYIVYCDVTDKPLYGDFTG
jgi:hypothetical protein